jgi:uncharacterized coiled-coil protein SlyX
MTGLAETIVVAVAGAIPTLLVYFGSRKKQKAEAESLVATSFEKLTKSMETRMEALDKTIEEQALRLSTQDGVIAQQNISIAEQNQTILRQTNRIAAQDKLIAAQSVKIQEQELTINSLQEQLVKATGKKGNVGKGTGNSGSKHSMRYSFFSERKTVLSSRVPFVEHLCYNRGVPYYSRFSY